MGLRSSAESSGIIAQAFHWLVALLVLAQLGIGLYAANLPVSLARLRWLSHHKSLGLFILALVLLRLGWRALNRPPGLPGLMPRWGRRAALATPPLFYLLLIFAPLAGWLYPPAAGLSANSVRLRHLPPPPSHHAHLTPPSP